jgi:circadian clock protein KaiC
MGLHFVVNGARQGQPGVIASLQENPTQLERILHGFGWSLTEPNVEVMYCSPVDIYVDEWVHDLLERIEQTGASRVLIDSLADLRLAAGDEIRFREFVYSLVQRFSRQGVSVMMTFEIPQLFGADRLSEAAVSPLADNLVMLSYLRERDVIERTMAVIKTRATVHDPTVRKFTIGPQGIVLDELVASVLLDRRSPAAIHTGSRPLVWEVAAGRRCPSASRAKGTGADG